MDSEHELDGDANENEPANAIAVGELIGFVTRAAIRHVWFGVGIGGGIVVAGLVLSMAVPMKYGSTARILVDDTATKTESLSSGERALPTWDPTSGVVELLTQKSSLISMVEETGLLSNWEATRPSLLKWKDRVTATLVGAPTLDEKKEALANMLRDSFFVSRDKNIVTILVIWKDPKSAYQLAKLAQVRLIDTIRSRETGIFSSAITILEEETKLAREAIEPALMTVVQVRDQSAKSALTPIGSSESATAPAASAGANVGRRTQQNASVGGRPKGTGQTVAAQLAEIGNKIRLVEEPWRRRQVEVQTRLTELKTVYGQAHPLVIQQEAQVKTAAAVPAELIELRNTQSQLLSKIQGAPDDNPYEDDSRRSRVASNISSGTRSTLTVARTIAGERGEREVVDEDPTVTAAKAGLTSAIGKYSRLTERLASARLQFTTAQVAFNTRFVVTGEPEVPRKPLKPMKLLVSIGSIVFGLLAAFLAGAVRELITGRIREPWQVKSIGLKILGELSVPKQMDR